VIDIPGLKALDRIDLGGPREITKVRYGERLFNNAFITFRRQFSCHTCHPDGHIDMITYDTEPDGIGVEPVDNRTLRGILDTAPFKWTGKNPSFSRQCGARLSTYFTRLQPFTREQLSALDLYICTIPRPPNRYRPVGAPLSEAQHRGKLVFERTMTADGRIIPKENRCATCHFPPLYTDRRLHDVGTRFPIDTTGLFETPHLNNIYDSAPHLHNGIAETLEEIWTRYNPDDKHGVTNDMTKDQLNDLVEYLKTLKIRTWDFKDDDNDGVADQPHTLPWKAYLDPDGEMEIDLYRDDGIVHVIITGASPAEDIMWVSSYFGCNRYGRFGVREVRDSSRRLGKPVPMEMAYAVGPEDFSLQIERLKAANVEAVVHWGDAVEGAKILSQMRAAGMKQPYFACDRCLLDEFTQIAGANAEGIVCASPWNPQRADPKLEAFREAYRKKFHEEPMTYAAHAYDGMNMLIWGIQVAGLNRAKIRDVIAYRTKPWPGVTGDIPLSGCLDADSEPTAPPSTARSIETTPPASLDFAPQKRLLAVACRFRPPEHHEQTVTMPWPGRLRSLHSMHLLEHCLGAEHLDETGILHQPSHFTERIEPRLAIEQAVRFAPQIYPSQAAIAIDEPEDEHASSLAIAMILSMLQGWPMR